MIAALAVGALVDRYVNTEYMLAVSHLVGAGLLFAMARAFNPRTFYFLALAYGVAFAPTLNLVNSIVFAHNDDLFGGQAETGFPWIRVFGTIGWIIAGLSHALILKKGEPINERPLLLAAGLSLVLGLYSLTLPTTPPAAADGGVSILGGMREIVGGHPIFFAVTFVAAMAMGLYFAFAALFLEKTGVESRVVGPVMTIGQAIEIFFLLTLPWFLGANNERMFWVLLVGASAWAVRFGLFAVGRPLALVLCGVAIHGLCFDFFFAAGFINSSIIAPDGLNATAQSIYGFLVYGVGMYVGSELSGWWNERVTAESSSRPSAAADDPLTSPVAAPDAVVASEPGVTTVAGGTDWRRFWAVPCGVVAAAALAFAIFGGRGG